MILYPEVKDRLEDIERIQLITQESGYRIINKVGPLNNPADRDHCLQYMVAIPLIYGNLVADHYEDKIAADPRIDRLRELMTCEEESVYSEDYLDPQKRSIANAIQIHFKDGSSTEKVEIHYPVGHRNRREEGIPLLVNKFTDSIRGALSSDKVEALLEICETQEKFASTDLDCMMRILRGSKL